MPCSARPQVRWRQHGPSFKPQRRLWCLHPCFSLFYLQESVELKQVEIVSDTEGYPNLEGHSRAASLPRLNAEYYVRPSLLIMPLISVLAEKISLAGRQHRSCQPGTYSEKSFSYLNTVTHFNYNGLVQAWLLARHQCYHFVPDKPPY